MTAKYPAAVNPALSLDAAKLLASGLLFNTTGTGAQSIATAAQLATALSALLGSQASFPFRAAQLVTFTDPTPFFDDFLTGGSNWTTSLGGGTLARNAAGGSKLLLSSTAVPTSTPGLILGANCGAGIFMVSIPAGAGSKFYLEWRMQVTTAIDAAAIVGIIAGGLTAGANGPVSTGFFTATFDATTLTSTVPVDTAYHVHRLWRDGTTTTYSVDSEAVPPTSVNGYLAAVALVSINARNGATAANRAAEYDYFGIDVER